MKGKAKLRRERRLEEAREALDSALAWVEGLLQRDRIEPTWEQRGRVKLLLGSLEARGMEAEAVKVRAYLDALLEVRLAQTSIAQAERHAKV